eukprot:COSAG01_NODE_1445_length_10281_cov_33.445099_9_plen_123_part_00
MVETKLRENYPIIIDAFDEFDSKGDGLLSSDEFRLGFLKLAKAGDRQSRRNIYRGVPGATALFNITEINALRDAMLKLHEAYRQEKRGTFKIRVRDDLSSYMYVLPAFAIAHYHHAHAPSHT